MKALCACTRAFDKFRPVARTRREVYFFLAAGFITTGFPWKTTLVIRNNRYTRQIWSIWLKRLPVFETKT